MTTKEPEITPPKLPRPFDTKHLDSLLVEITGGDRTRGLAILRDVYARGLEHGAAVNAFWRAQKTSNAAVMAAPDEAKKQRAMALTLEVAADGMKRTAVEIRSGSDIATELDELRRLVMKKEEPDPGEVLGWLAVERARAAGRAGAGTTAAMDRVRAAESETPAEDPEAMNLHNARAAVVIRGTSINLPDGLPLEVGDPVEVRARGHVARAAVDRRVDGLSIVLDVVDFDDLDCVDVTRLPAFTRAPEDEVRKSLERCGVDVEG